MKTIFGLLLVLMTCGAFLAGALLIDTERDEQVRQLQQAGYELQQKYRLCDVPKFEGNI